MSTGSAEIILGEIGIRSVGFSQQVLYDMKRNVLEHVVHALKYAMDNILPVVAEIHGFWAEFYYPYANEASAYGFVSDEQGYHEQPDLRMRVAITGLVIDRFLSGDNVDNYMAPPPTIFAPGDLRLPENTKIRVLMRNSKYMEFQLDRQDALYGMDEVLVTKLVVMPVAAQF